MKIRNILYISAIMLLAGCSKDADISNSTTLSGNGEKTPLLINATLDTGKGQTRAIGDTFEDGDVLRAYVRHTIEGTLGNYTILNTDYAEKSVTININKDNNNVHFTSDSYWDDFSNSASDDTNVRTSGHGLHALYGYCTNGGSYSITEGTGVINWTIGSGDSYIDQSTAEKVKNADLLVAPEIATVSYSHGASYSADHNKLNLSFKHAMSQITVVVTADNNEGFISNNPLQYTELMLNDMNTATQITAPNATTTFSPLKQEPPSDNIKDVMMYGDASYPDDNQFVRTYTAIVAPGTKIVKDATFLNIVNADGNNYEVKVNTDMLSTAAGKWGDGLSGTNQIVENSYIVTQPGKNYRLNITIQKSAVQVSATLAPWSTVTATGTGAIQFTDDVTVTTPSSGFKNDGTSAFSLFWVKHDGDHDTPAERANTAYTYATTSTTNNGSDWTNTPALYWPNKNDSYYFRALAKVTGGDVTAATPELTTEAWNTTDIALTENYYILWGTSGGTAISPRTGGVPMEFRVVNKCKVSFTLATAGDYDAEKDPATYAAMPLSEATISINNIYTKGTINLEDGTVTGDENFKTTLGGSTNSIAEQEVLAQRISNDAVVTIAFKKDATEYSTFKIRLKDCVSGGSTPITVWEGGHTYNYTIRVEKEAVKFSAAVKSWDTISGSGTATMVNE